MTGLGLYLAAAMVLFAAGTYGFLIQPNLLRKLVSLNFVAAGIFLALVVFAARGETPDPVPHALVLTGIVISVSATAYGIALAGRLYRKTGADSLEEEPEGD